VSAHFTKCSHLYIVAVVHKIYNTNHEARLNFVLILLCVRDGETDIALFLFTNGYTESHNNRQWSAANPLYFTNAITCYIWVYGVV